MVEKKYRCDICQDEHEKDSFGSKLIGYRFGTTNYFDKVECAIAERHICEKCLKGFKGLNSK